MSFFLTANREFRIGRIVSSGAICALLVATWLFGIHRINVDAHEVAVLISKPYFIGHGGVDPIPLTAGSQWVAMSTDAVKVPIVPREFPEAFKDMNTSDNFPVHFETNLQLQIIGEKSPELLSKFGAEWYANNVKQKFREIVRNQVGQKHMTALVTRSPELEKVQAGVSKDISDYIVSIGLPAKFIRVTFSQIDPNEKVIQERAETAQQQQRIKTEDQRKLAEDGRKAAEMSRADADQAYATKMNLSSEQFVRLEGIKAGERMVKTCVESGKTGCNILVGAGANAQPMMNLK